MNVIWLPYSLRSDNLVLVMLLDLQSTFVLVSSQSASDISL